MLLGEHQKANLKRNMSKHNHLVVCAAWVSHASLGVICSLMLLSYITKLVVLIQANVKTSSLSTRSNPSCFYHGFHHHIAFFVQIWITHSMNESRARNSGAGPSRRNHPQDLQVKQTRRRSSLRCPLRSTQMACSRDQNARRGRPQASLLAWRTPNRLICSRSSHVLPWLALHQSRHEPCHA